MIICFMPMGSTQHLINDSFCGQIIIRGQSLFVIKPRILSTCLLGTVIVIAIITRSGSHSTSNTNEHPVNVTTVTM